jgi:hypothetical protein
MLTTTILPFAQTPVQQAASIEGQYVQLCRRHLQVTAY